MGCALVLLLIGLRFGIGLDWAFGFCDCDLGRDSDLAVF
jgi:hypothetical protein